MPISLPNIQPRQPPLLHLLCILLIPPPMHKPHNKKHKRNSDSHCNSNDTSRGDGVEFFLVEFYPWVADVCPISGGFICVPVDSESCIFCEPWGRNGCGGAFNAICRGKGFG